MPANNTRKNSKKMDLTKDIEEVARPKKNESRNELVIPEQGSSFAKIAFTFIGLAIILFAIVFYFSYLYTTLTITPNPQTIKADFETQITFLDSIKKESESLDDVYKMIESWSVSNPDKISGEVLIQEIEEEKSFVVASEGGEKKDGTAHGIITVFNKQNVTQDLIKKTRFQTEDGIIFRIREAIKVPANGKIETEVFADEDGESGNIGPNTFILPGFSSESKRKAVYAESYAPMAGGVVYEKILTQDDVNEAKTELQEILYNTGLVKLDEELKTISNQETEEQKLPTDSLDETGVSDSLEEGLINDYDRILTNATVQEILDIAISPEIGTKTENFTIKMKLMVTAILFNEENLLALAKLNIENKDKDGRQLTRISDESLNYSIKKYDSDLGMAILNVSLSGEGYITSADLLGKFKLNSLEPEAIQAYLDAHPEIANIEIKEAPIWMRKLPILKDRVKIEVELPME